MRITAVVLLGLAGVGLSVMPSAAQPSMPVVHVGFQLLPVSLHQ